MVQISPRFMPELPVLPVLLVLPELPELPVLPVLPELPALPTLPARSARSGRPWRRAYRRADLPPRRVRRRPLSNPATGKHVRMNMSRRTGVEWPATGGTRARPVAWRKDVHDGEGPDRRDRAGGDGAQPGP